MDTPESLFLGEARAYRHQAAFALKLRRPKVAAAATGMADFYAAEAEKTKGMTREQVKMRYPDMRIPDEHRSLSPSDDGGPENPEYLRIESELKFIESAGRIKREKEQAEQIRKERETTEENRKKEEAERLKREREFAERESKQSITTPLADISREVERLEREKAETFRQVKLSWDWLRGAAARACAEPGRLTQADVELIHFSHYWLKDHGPKFSVPRPESAAQDLTGCPRDVLLKWLEFKDVTVPEYLRERVYTPKLFNDAAVEISAQHRPPPPPQNQPYDGGDGDTEKGGGRGYGGTCPERDGGSACRWRNRPR